jgi:hypothetical protein
MYINTVTDQSDQMSYTCHLLRDELSRLWEEHRTIANLSHCSQNENAVMCLVFNYKIQIDTPTTQLNAVNAYVSTSQVSKTSVCKSITQVKFRQSKSIGAVWHLAKLADELNIVAPHQFAKISEKSSQNLH